MRTSVARAVGSIALVSVLIAGCWGCHGQGLILTPGEPRSFGFSGLPLRYLVEDPITRDTAEWEYRVIRFDAGPSAVLRSELFATPSSLTPFGTFEDTISGLGTSAYYGRLQDVGWSDREGLIRLTWLGTEPIDLSFLSVTALTPFNDTPPFPGPWVADYSSTLVPEPTPLGVLCVGVAACAIACLGRTWRKVLGRRVRTQRCGER
jgi:hypothetical protein